MMVDTAWGCIELEVSSTIQKKWLYKGFFKEIAGVEPAIIIYWSYSPYSHPTF